MKLLRRSNPTMLRTEARCEAVTEHSHWTPVDRRAFLLTTVVGLVGTRLSQAQSAITRPVVSEKACPLETIFPVAADGHRGLAVLRKPPGAGPFPVIVWFHGDIVTRPLARLEETARDLATGSRFLAAATCLLRRPTGAVTSTCRPTIQ